MDTIDAVINIMRLNCFMGSIDLANAYFSVPIVRRQNIFKICVEFSAVSIYSLAKRLIVSAAYLHKDVEASLRTFETIRPHRMWLYR